jgi:glycerol-3-phosphate dehydrogenase (NAD(P)+)
MTTVAVIGDGQMGLVLADALHCQGSEVRLWGPFSDSVEELRETRKSPRLKEFTLNDSIVVTDVAHEALNTVDVAINAIPTQFIRTVWGNVSSELPEGIPIGCVAKGIELGTHLLPTQILEETIGDSHTTCVLSGPTIATHLPS